MIFPKALVLSRDSEGTLKVRADFDVDVLEPINKRMTLSRQMENVILSKLAYDLSEAYDAVFLKLNEGIPPE